MSYKMLFTDLDGTLLSSDSSISKGNLKSIEKALSKDYKIVLSSGRATKSVYDFVETIGLNKKGCYSVTFNGAAIIDNYTKQCIHRADIPMGTASVLFDKAREMNLAYHTYTHEYVIVDTATIETIEYSNFANMEYREIGDIAKNFNENPIKVIIHGDKERLLEFKDSLDSWAKDKLNAVFTSDTKLEYNDINATKGIALNKLADMLNIEVNKTIAVGDGDNDIPMLVAAGLGVAVANAVDTAKASSEYITTSDNNSDAIKEVIDKFFLSA